MTFTAHDTTDEFGSSRHCCIRVKVSRNPCGYLTKSLNKHNIAFFRRYGCGCDVRLLSSGNKSRARSSVTILDIQLIANPASYTPCIPPPIAPRSSFFSKLVVNRTTSVSCVNP